MNEESSLFREYLAPCMICMIRGWIGETTIISKSVVNDINYVFWLLLTSGLSIILTMKILILEVEICDSLRREKPK